MNRFDGNAARQLELLDATDAVNEQPQVRERNRPQLRLLRKDVYAELARRRRRAQIAARHLIENEA